eukprot:14543547-Ditylum_brightwellii.AAC.1
MDDDDSFNSKMDDDDSFPPLLDHIFYGDTDDEWNSDNDYESEELEDEELRSEVDFCKAIAALYFLVLRKPDPEKWK